MAAIKYEKTIVWSMLLVVVFLLKSNTLYQVPVWDSTMSIFSAAAYLYETDFNLMALIQQEGWLNAEPNVHSLSLMTWLTASVMWLTNGSEIMLPLLHLLQFVMTAFLLLGLYLFIRPILQWKISILVCLATLVCPIFWVQAGYMYMEIPIALCTIYALLNWSENKFYHAVLWVTLACMVKSFGLVVVATLAIASLIESRPLKHRLLRLAGLLILPVLVEYLKIISAPSQVPVDAMSYVQYLQLVFFPRFIHVPDMVLLISVAFLASIIRYKQIIFVLSHPPCISQKGKIINHQRRILSYILIAVFVFFILTVPLTGGKFWPLARYYVLIIPFLIFLSADFFRIMFFMVLQQFQININARPRLEKAEMMTVVFLLGLITFFLLNQSGRFYPGSSQTIGAFSIIERSGQYVDYLSVQQAGIKAISEIKNTPVFVNRPDYYNVSSPLFGYVNKKLPNVKLVLREPYVHAQLKDYPQHFFMLYSNQGHGGEIMLAVIIEAEKNAKNEVKIAVQYERNGFKVSLVEIKQFL